jgi:hypothetical protein
MKRAAVLAGIVTAYAALATIRLTSPFHRHHEGICATHAVHARNHVLHGLGVTRLGHLELGGEDLSVHPGWRDDFYPNRPTVSILAPALFIAVLGDAEWVFRLNLVLVGAATVLVFAALARRLLDPPWDLVASGIFALLPIFTYFSHIATHLSYVLLFSLLAWYANLRWDDGRRFRVLLFLSLVLACQSDWPGYFAAFSIAVHRFRGLRSPLSWAVLGVAVACFALHLLHLAWLVPDGRLVKRFLLGGADRSFLESPPLLAYVAEEAREIALYFGAGTLVLAVAGWIRFVRTRHAVPLLLLLLGLEEIVFTYLAYWHDFLTYPLLAGVALAAAEGAAVLWARPRARPAVVALLVAAAVQAAWVGAGLHTQPGPYDDALRVNAAIRAHTSPRDRVLLTLPDAKRLGQYYSRRFVASCEGRDTRLSIRYAGAFVRIASEEDFVRHLSAERSRYDVVVVGRDQALLRSALDALAPARPVGDWLFYRVAP